MVYRSYGIIAYRKNAKKDLEFLLVKNKSGGRWGFPKGTPDEGEIAELTAIREFEEETGFKAPSPLSSKFFTEEYGVNYGTGNSCQKICTYWTAEMKTNEKVGDVFSDIEEIAWKNFDDALKTITFDRSREVLREVKNTI